MTNVGDVKSVWAWTLDSWDRESSGIRKLNVNELSTEGLRQVLEGFETRKTFKRKAIRLFRNIKKQICADNRIESKDFSCLTDDVEISQEAQKKFRGLLDFIGSNEW